MRRSEGWGRGRPLQIFHRSTNVISKVSILGAVFFIAAFVWALTALARSPYATMQEVARTQPVQFSHAHHVGGLGIDCRYCHTTAETAAIAGVPPTRTCMNCHSQIWARSPFLEPVRESFRSGKSIAWTRVNDLPDFVYFDHSIHVRKGIGCTTCHGPIDRMELTWEAHALQMEWCLACHREPEKFVRPREEVFSLEWNPRASEQAAIGPALAARYGIARETSCSVCHR